MYVYVLRLQDDCWYVGKSANVERRLQQHIDAAGAVWTELHPPLSTDALFSVEDVADIDASGRETRRTAQLMLEYGVNSVRGGPWTRADMYRKDDLDGLVNGIGHALDLTYQHVRNHVAFQLESDSNASDSDRISSSSSSSDDDYECDAE